MAYEQPRFEVTKRFSDFELRDYQPYVIAETEVEASHAGAGNEGFRRLAGYIFGKNKGARKIAMTAPVTEARATRIAMTAPVAEVATGDPDHFLIQFMMPFYTDPSLESYRLAGLRHGLGSSMSPRVALHAVAALREGFRQRRTQGDPVQQGGVFVITKGGGLLYQYVSREAGDHPDNADLLRALDEDGASRSRT
jgi:hypothetical protein